MFFLHCPWNPSEPISNLHHLNRWIYISFNSHNGRLCVVFIGNWWSKNRATKCWMSARFIRANWIKEISNLTLNSLSSFKKTQIFEHFIWSCYELSVQSDSVSGLSTLTICSNGLVIVTMWVLFLLYVNRCEGGGVSPQLQRHFPLNLILPTTRVTCSTVTRTITSHPSSDKTTPNIHFDRKRVFSPQSCA